jgi:S1/P1 nuclease
VEALARRIMAIAIKLLGVGLLRYDKPKIIYRSASVKPMGIKPGVERIMHFVDRKLSRNGSRWASAMAIVPTFCSTGTALAWGRLGHRVISRLAEQRLTDKAKAGIADLLPPGESIADASTWVDEHRRDLPKTAPWHYVDVPLDESTYEKSGLRATLSAVAWSTSSGRSCGTR